MKDPPESMTDAQVAHQLGLSESTIKKIRDKALAKLSSMKVFKEIKALHGSEALVEERLIDPYEDSYYDVSKVSVLEISEEEAPSSDD
jgi:hypothetical protein